MNIIQLSPLELHEKLTQTMPLVLLDVRETYEFNFAHLAGSLHIPLKQLPQHVVELDPQQPIVTICHHGLRSQQAAEYLKALGFTQVFNLTGGIDAWALLCDPQMLRY